MADFREIMFDEDLLHSFSITGKKNVWLSFDMANLFGEDINRSLKGAYSVKIMEWQITDIVESIREPLSNGENLSTMFFN